MDSLIILKMAVEDDRKVAIVVMYASRIGPLSHSIYCETNGEVRDHIGSK